jgi:hypothetical protein
MLVRIFISYSLFKVNVPGTVQYINPYVDLILSFKKKIHLLGCTVK